MNSNYILSDYIDQAMAMSRWKPCKRSDFIRR